MTKWKQRREEHKRMRNELAAKAMQGLLASTVNGKPQEFGEYSYKFADAVMKARKS